jgi:3-methyladenine DNA glycosylase AlkD
MITATRLDLPAEAAAITAALEARRDPAYEAGMRRTVPSSFPAHATRVPVIRAVASEWRREHRDVPNDDLLSLCERLWNTGWREERIVAIILASKARPRLTAHEWPRFEAWSAGLENWEHVDHLAGALTGRLLAEQPSLFACIESLSLSDNPWQRRLALVTLIEAFRLDEAWRAELQSMAARLRTDKHALVRRAVVWARDRLKKDHLNA